MQTLYIITGPDNELWIFNTKEEAKQFVEDCAKDCAEGPYVAHECAPLEQTTDIATHVHGVQWDIGDGGFCSCVDGEFNDHENNPPIWMRFKNTAEELTQMNEPTINTTDHA